MITKLTVDHKHTSSMRIWLCQSRFAHGIRGKHQKRERLPNLKSFLPPSIEKI